jgi:SpoVK/Ycf46/Vps4 family AAA+-type ATPase
MAEAYFTLAHKLAPSILFVDEIDCLFPKQRGAGEHEATATLRSQFLSLWDGMLSLHGPLASTGHVVLIGATNRADNIDEAILRRMPCSIEIRMPDEQARADVLSRMLRDEAMARELDIAALARECAGYSGSDLEALCCTAAMRPLDELLAREKLAEAGAAAANGVADDDAQPRCAASGAAGSEGVLGEPSDSAPEVTRGGAADLAGAKGASGEGGVVSAPEAEAELRPLTLDDFREAMRVVRPSGDRLSRPLPATLAAAPDPTGGVDWALYD